MVICCVVPGCKTRFIKGTTKLYCFPKDEESRLLWLLAIKRKKLGTIDELWKPKSYLSDRVCYLHFISGKPCRYDKTHPDYIPSIFPLVGRISYVRSQAKMKRYQRLRKRKCVQFIPSAVEHSNIDLNQDRRSISKSNDDVVAEISQERSISESNADMVADISQERESNILRAASDDNTSTSYEDKDGTSQKRIEDADLLLNLSKTNENIIFDELKELRGKYDVLSVEYQRMMCENMALKESISKMKFSYSNLTEAQLYIFTGLQSIALFTWILNLVKSYMRNMNNVSFGDQLLIILMKIRLNLTNADLGYRFQVSPSSISRTLSSGIPGLAKCLSFLVKWPSKNEEGLAARCTSVAIPLFEKEKAQLPQQEIEYAKMLPRVKIPVEQAIGKVNKYRILQGILQSNLSKHADDIIMITSALTNLRPTLVET